MAVLLPVLGFLFVTLLIGAAALAFAPAGGGVIQRRLNELRGIDGDAVDPQKFLRAGLRLSSG